MDMVLYLNGVHSDTSVMAIVGEKKDIDPKIIKLVFNIII